MRFFDRIATFLLLITSLAARAQSPAYRHEIQLTSDNDTYLLDLLDGYYTVGTQLDWRVALRPPVRPSWRSRFRRVLLGAGVAQRIYTPRIIYRRSPDELDRPYAGWASVRASLTVVTRGHAVLTAGADLGVTGDASGARPTQTAWHRLFGMVPPRHWDYQIHNAAVGHVGLLAQYRLVSGSWVDAVGESSGQVGTLHRWVAQGALLRVGRVNPPDASWLSRARLGTSQRKEKYFFLGASVSRVFANGLIDGPLAGGRTLGTGRSLPWVGYLRWGGTYGGNRADCTVTVVHLTPELTGGRSHAYASVALAVRF